jgi:hypothetical protein
MAREDARPPIITGVALLFCGTLVNPRYGPMAWGVIVLYLFVDGSRSVRERIREALLLATPVAASCGFAYWMMQRNPAFVDQTMVGIRTHMWLSPFLSAMLFHLFVVPQEVVRTARSLPRAAKFCAYAAMSYLVLYAVLYILYNAYYGNFWLCLDVTSAIRISDWALLGPAVTIAIFGVARIRLIWPSSKWNPIPSPVKTAKSILSMPPNIEFQWLALWLLLFLSVAISAFGQGWFLRLVPERAMIFLALPMAVFAAAGIQRRKPVLARALLVLMLIGGGTAVAVASACFQGPLGHRPGQGPYAYAHCEIVNIADAEVLDGVDGGVVLTPATYGPSIGDVVTQRANTSAVYGYASFDLSDRDPQKTKEDCIAFFSEGAASALRETLVDEWCVDYVYCPDFAPVSDAVIAELRALPWLTEVKRSERAILFRVTRPRH